MRLHTLTITAFGPFAGTETIDFESLNNQGIFLLTGPTGAGKTSILDAVCFALYGSVPGDRNTAKSLRSDHAGPETAPEVRLDVSVAGRRLRLTRAPEWNRPKRRGEGTTLEHAKAVLEEHHDHQWRGVSTRIPEVNQFIDRVMGMNAEQFTQVALLPQGHFQRFLRAKPEERHGVLERLFRTKRFADMELWLVNRRKELAGQSSGHHRDAAGVVHRILEAAGCDLPDGWDASDLTQVADSGALETWVDRLVDDATEAVTTSAVAEAAAQDAASRAREELEAGRDAARRRDAHARALAIRADLDATQTAAEASAAELDAAERAVSVAALVAELDKASGVFAATVERAAAVRAQLATEWSRRVDGVTPADAKTARDEVLAALSEARTHQATDLRLREVDEQVAQHDASIARLGSVLAEHDLMGSSLPARKAALLQQRDEAAGLAALATARAADLDRCTGALASAHEAERLAGEILEAEHALLEMRESAVAAREEYLALRETRMEGISAELAQHLVAGEPCSVCGSADHPAPARTLADAPTAESVAAAEAAAQRVSSLVTQAQNQFAELTSAHQLARQRAGSPAVADLVRAVEVARSLLAESSEAAAAVAAFDAERARLDTAAATWQTERDTLRTALAAAESARAGLGEERGRLTALLSSVLGDHADLSTLLAHLTVAVEERTDQILVLEQEAEAGLAVDRARSSVEEEAAARGFHDPDDARTAVRSDEARSDIRLRLSARAAQRAQSDDVLADGETLRALALPNLDLGELDAELAEADKQRSARGADLRTAQSRAVRLTDLRSELAMVLTAWAPTRHAYALADRVAKMVEGKSADNVWRMRLSAYVLSERLSAVVDAANARLGPMNDQRYQLQQSDERGRGELRGGLSLRVLDAWSGEARHPATLSGGETFVVSLALALGLADVVAAEAGGADIDTLFIDEGFGSLDAETLDTVMNTLDDLRDRGRTIGLVSHVAEMRSRIPTQLQVVKARTGSTIKVHSGLEA
jgi:exonuclease SbcC